MACVSRCSDLPSDESVGLAPPNNSLSTLKLGEGLPGEEFRGIPAVGNFPRGRLCAVLAKFQRMRLRRFGPCATDAHIAVRTALMGQS